MIIGDPIKFGIIADRVDEWNPEGHHDFCNGFFALSIDETLFPNHIINACVSVCLYEVLDTLREIPDDEELWSLSPEEAFRAICNRVYPPPDWDIHNDYRYLLSPTWVADEGCYVFAIRCGDRVRIMGTRLEYDRENSEIIFDDSAVHTVEVDMAEVQSIVRQIEESLPLFDRENMPQD